MSAGNALQNPHRIVESGMHNNLRLKCLKECGLKVHSSLKLTSLI